MAYTQAKAHAGGAKIEVNTVNFQVRDPYFMPNAKDQQIASKGSGIAGILRSGVSMIETIISGIILLGMAIIFKIINAKQSEFDKLEARHQ